MREATEVLLGPPGTGKTTALMKIVQKFLEDGLQPHQICFVTFTKRGADEAKYRAMEKFSFGADDLPWFRTLHSLAFRFHNLDRTDVMGYSNYIDICNMLGLTISSRRIDEDSYVSTTTRGDRLFFMENLARSMRVPLKQIHEKFVNDDIQYAELELLEKTLQDYKRIRQKMDFTDMLVHFVKMNQAPDVEVLIVDEAQDLTRLQWEMVDVLSRNVKHFYIAGDDDQAIYTWAGADIETFLSVKGERKVLDQSWRVPSSVHVVANKIVQKIHTRAEKVYLPRDFPGKIEHHQDFTTIDMSKGTWLLLARNQLFLPQYSDYCLEKGHLYEAKHGSQIPEGAGRVILNWEKLRRGEKLRAYEAKEIYNFMRVKTRVKFGFKKLLDALPDEQMIDIIELETRFGLICTDIWRIALNMLQPHIIGYFVESLKRGEKITRDPRIRINTIHGVKGGEAENVVLMTDMTKRTFEEFQRNPDNEHRVWYVGVTRAKSTLYVISPRTPYFYDL
jgi:DNA helicase II / ATP-dependent DNA helicase PcrA